MVGLKRSLAAEDGMNFEDILSFEYARKSEDCEGKNVVEDNTYGKGNSRLAIGEDVALCECLKSLGQGVEECCRKTDSYSVFYRNKHHGQHTCHRDRAAHRHLKKLCAGKRK